MCPLLPLSSLHATVQTKSTYDKILQVQDCKINISIKRDFFFLDLNSKIQHIHLIINDEGCDNDLHLFEDTAPEIA
jgi:hypothetical protein